MGNSETVSRKTQLKQIELELFRAGIKSDIVGKEMNKFDIVFKNSDAVDSILAVAHESENSNIIKYMEYYKMVHNLRYQALFENKIQPYVDLY